MRKQPSPSPEGQHDIATLAEVVSELSRQVRQLALILDEVREELVWAVRNDKFSAAGASHEYVASRLPNARFELLEGGGHFLDEEWAVVLDWLSAGAGVT